MKNGETPGSQGVSVFAKGPEDKEKKKIIQEKLPIIPEGPQPGKTASVGLSISIGMSTDYGKEKIDVAAWCTLPCTPDAAGTQSAYDECAARILEQLQPRLDEAVAKFFPHLGESQE